MVSKERLGNALAIALNTAVVLVSPSRLALAQEQTPENAVQIEPTIPGKEREGAIIFGVIGAGFFYVVGKSIRDLIKTDFSDLHNR